MVDITLVTMKLSGQSLLAPRSPIIKGIHCLDPGLHSPNIPIDFNNLTLVPPGIVLHLRGKYLHEFQEFRQSRHQCVYMFALLDAIIIAVVQV